MMTFKSFLLERMVDPEMLAHRVARRFGTKSSYGQWMKTQKHQHIPMKAYNASTANAVERRGEKVFDNLGGNDNYHAAHTSSHFNIADLHPTQPFVRTDNHETLKNKIKEKQPKHILVASHKGKHFIMDGHHAVMAASLRGETSVPVKHINFDEH